MIRIGVWYSAAVSILNYIFNLHQREDYVAHMRTGNENWIQLGNLCIMSERNIQLRNTDYVLYLPKHTERIPA